MYPLLISFSGGRTSAFMTKYLLERWCNREKVVVFANTGKEREETLEFINKCDTEFHFNTVWIESVINEKQGYGTDFRIVTFDTANRDGLVFEHMIKKYGIPNQPFPHCTRELKLVPISKYMKSLGYKDWETAIGIRYDERHRINRRVAAEKRYIYPLADEIKCDAEFIRNFWDRQLFDLTLNDYEGNCDMCWKKSKRKLLTLIKEKPRLIEWWDTMESKYGNKEIHFFRNNVSAKELIELSKTRFSVAVDAHSLQNNQGKFTFDDDMDIEYDCFCKST